MDADVNKAEMMLSESDSKYVFGVGVRENFTIKNSTPEKSIENSSDEKTRTDPDRSTQPIQSD